MLPLLRPIVAALIAAAMSSALAQAPAPLVLPPEDDSNTTALPIIRNNQVEGFLLIESGAGSPTRTSLDRMLGRNASPTAGAGIIIPFDNGRRVGTSLTLESNPTVGLLCNGNSVSRSLGSLAQHCMVANLAPNASVPFALSRPGIRVETRLEGERAAITGSLGLNRFNLESPLALPGSTAIAPSDLMLAINGAEFEQESVGLLGELKVGETGWVSIGGTLARARIVPADQLPGGVRPEWNTGTLSLGGGVGSFGGEIIGRVIEIPGSSNTFSNVGLGVTWRAPWKARLSVGAENLSSHGKNPFSNSSSSDDESSRVPYIRYEQDL